MALVQTDELIDTIEELVQASELALSTENVGQFTEFEKHVNEVDAYVREVQQGMWSDPAKTTIRNLERGEPLTPNDKELIETFLISDAEQYLKHENNYDDWKHELKRIMKEVKQRSRTVDQNTIGDLRGILKDAVRLVPDIRNYLDERGRVEKCKSALDNLNEPARKQLVNLLREQLSSPKR
jgi:hypothetical protein